jgi:hypothetical protein
MTDILAEAERLCGARTQANPGSSTVGQVHHFPEEAWSPEPLRIWREVVADSTEAPEEFLWAAYIVAAGLALGRNLWIKNPLPLFANFYVLLSGRTGESKKSTTLRLIRELIGALGVEVEVLSGVVSSEGVYERLNAEAHPSGVSALVYVDEFAALANAARRRATADLFPRLNTLYYCPPEDKLDRRNSPTRIVHPFVGVIAAAPSSQLAELVTGSDISSGTLNRYLIVSGNEQAPKPRPPALSEGDFQRIALPLKAIADGLRDRPLEMKWGGPEAEDLYDQFYWRWKDLRRHGEASELTSRTPEHVLKVAMLYAALRGETRLSAESVAIAMLIGGWAEGSATRLLGDVGLGHLGRAEEWIVLALRRGAGRIRTRQLQQTLPKHLRGDFSRAIDGLIKADIVWEDVEDERSGNRTKWLVLKPTPNTQDTLKKDTSVLGVGPDSDPFAIPQGVLERAREEDPRDDQWEPEGLV